MYCLPPTGVGELVVGDLVGAKVEGAFVVVGAGVVDGNLVGASVVGDTVGAKDVGDLVGTTVGVVVVGV
jgi:hypothetical protein